MSASVGSDRGASDPGSRKRRGVFRWGRSLRRRDQAGLTLVELMIVVTIVAIIAVIAMAIYQDIVKKSKLAADQGTVASLRSAVAIYYGQNNGMFPSSGNLEGLVTPKPAWNCTVSYVYESSNGKITFTANLNDCP